MSCRPRHSRGSSSRKEHVRAGHRKWQGRVFPAVFVGPQTTVFFRDSISLNLHSSPVREISLSLQYRGGNRPREAECLTRSLGRAGRSVK